MMDYKKIIVDSWQFTQKNKKLIYWFGFLPSFLTTTVGIGYIAYQFFAFKTSYLFDDEGHSFSFQVVNTAWNFISSHASLSLPLIITAAVLAVLYFLTPTLFKASAIQAIARGKNGQPYGVGIGLKYGFMAFLPLLEYHLLIKTFSWVSMVTEASFVVRNLGMEIFKMLLPVFIIVFVLSIFLTLLFTFADLFIVVDDEKVLTSMIKSAKLVVMNWQHTLLVTILMIIIGVRIIIQAVVVLFLPLLLFIIGGYLATLTIGTTLFVVAGVVGFLGLVVASYLSGVVEIFSYCVWTYTFLQLTSQKELSAREVVTSGEIPVKENIVHANLRG